MSLETICSCYQDQSDQISRRKLMIWWHGKEFKYRPEDLLLIRKIVQTMKDSKFEVVYVQIMEKAANLGPYVNDDLETWRPILVYEWAKCLILRPYGIIKDEISSRFIL